MTEMRVHRLQRGAMMVALGAFLLGLAGCGVKGGLEQPPSVEEQQAEQQKREERDEGWWERLLP